MVLAAVDDLLFASRLRNVARHAGVEIRFVRSPDALRAAVAERKPTLVILDLNADRVQPLDMLAALGDDPSLRDVRSVAYVRHTDGPRIAAARAAGATEVMARSAFVEVLPALLAGATPAAGTP